PLFREGAFCFMRARYNNGTRLALRRLLSNSRPAGWSRGTRICSTKRDNESTCRQEIQAIRVPLSPALPMNHPFVLDRQTWFRGRGRGRGRGRERLGSLVRMPAEHPTSNIHRPKIE